MGIGLAGVALFVKNSRIVCLPSVFIMKQFQFARFEHVSQIPKEFIRKELELKGQIREVC